MSRDDAVLRDLLADYMRRRDEAEASLQALVQQRLSDELHMLIDQFSSGVHTMRPAPEGIIEPPDDTQLPDAAWNAQVEAVLAEVQGWRTRQEHADG